MNVALDGPVVSFRPKQIRDGLEDWEVFRMPEAFGARDYVRAAVALQQGHRGEDRDAHLDLVGDGPLRQPLLAPFQETLVSPCEEVIQGRMLGIASLGTAGSRLR